MEILSELGKLSSGRRGQSPGTRPEALRIGTWARRGGGAGEVRVLLVGRQVRASSTVTHVSQGPLGGSVSVQGEPFFFSLSPKSD